MTSATAHPALDSVEALAGRIDGLVNERQRLRAEAVDQATLEANRLAIARLQQRLSQALIERFLPAAA